MQPSENKPMASDDQEKTSEEALKDDALWELNDSITLPSSNPVVGGSDSQAEAMEREVEQTPQASSDAMSQLGAQGRSDDRDEVFADDPEELETTLNDDESGEFLDSAEEEIEEDPSFGEGEESAKSKLFKPLELVTTLAVGVVLLFFLGWGLTEAWQFPKTDNLRKRAEMPVEGEFISVKGCDDFWRAPILTGPNPDRPRLGTKVLPVLDLQLSGGDGRLRFFFRNGKGELVGDPRTVQVSGGVFSETGTDRMEISSTIGFDHASEFGSYKYATFDYWRVEVFEGPSEGAEDSFKLLFSQDMGIRLEGNLYLEANE